MSSLQDSQPFPLARVNQHTSAIVVLCTEVMLRKKSKAVPEGNGPVPHQDEFRSDQPTMADLYRMVNERFDQSDRYLHRMKSHFKQQDTKLDELTENLKRANQRVVSLEQDARQPRHAMEADGPADKKTRERTEDVTTAAVQAMHGDSFSANRVDPNPESPISFDGDSIRPPTLSCSRDDALVGSGAAAPKSCLSPLEMCSPTAAGGLLPAGKTSTKRISPFISRVCGSAQSRRRVLGGRQLNTPCTTTSVSAGTSFLPPPEARLHRQYKGKLWYSIQAVLKAVYAPA